MERPVRFALYGLGTMGRRMLRYAVLHGAVPAAVFSRASHLGEDAGSVSGIDPLGIPVLPASDAARVLPAVRPDICLVSAQGTLASHMELFRICGEAGCDVLTIGEECQWPWTQAPELAEEADALAKHYGITISASGCPEVPWGTLAAAMTGCCAKVEKIRVSANLNLEFYGKGVLPLYPEHGIDLTMEEFETRIAAFEPILQMDGHLPCLPGDQNTWLCSKLGLTPVSQTARHEPLTWSEDVYSGNLERIIPAGHLLGMNMVVTTETAEGTTVEYAMAGKVFSPADREGYEISVTGEPSYHITVHEPQSPVFTAATPVNRIPDVLDAAPGFVPTSTMPAVQCLTGPLTKKGEKNDG